MRYVVLSLLVILLLAGCHARPQRPDLVVFAAASLTDAMQQIGAAYTAAHGTRVSFNFAGSNALAHELVAAPRADVFVSANERWMDLVGKAGLLAAGSRHDVLSNRLVVIARKKVAVAVTRPEQLCGLPFRKLALGNPEAVPAGIYARQWMQTVRCAHGTLWERWKKQVVPASDVRAALALVEADPSVFGVVYQSDARSSNKVKVIYTVRHGPPIRYTAAVVNGRPLEAQARNFLRFLGSPQAAKVFRSQGFVPLGARRG